MPKTANTVIVRPNEKRRRFFSFTSSVALLSGIGGGVGSNGFGLGAATAGAAGGTTAGVVGDGGVMGFTGATAGEAGRVGAGLKDRLKS